MDVKTITDDYVSKYVHMLDKLPDDDTNSLASLRVSILCSQLNKNTQLNRNESTRVEIHCEHCFTPWKNGKFVMKTHRKRHNKIGRERQNHHKSQSSFTMAMKCLVCLNVTSSLFDKNRILKEKTSIKSSTHTKIIDKTPVIKEEIAETVNKRKIKKKKRNLYAGLNPLVFKNRDLCKNKFKKLKT